MPTSFARDILPLFRQKDIDHMQDWIDLSNYEQVRDNAAMILSRLISQDGEKRMPPPPDAPWTPTEITTFARWIDQGCQP